MKLNRRGLFGFLAGAAVSVPAIPVMAEGLAKTAPVRSAVVHTSISGAAWRSYAIDQIRAAPAIRLVNSGARYADKPTAMFGNVPIFMADE